MKPIFVETSVLLLAVGSPHPTRDACRAVLTAAADGQFRIHLSVEAGQEFLFHRLRRTGRQQAIEQFDELYTLAFWHPFDVDVLRSARDLVMSGTVRGRDAVHAATALKAGFHELVTSDRDFDNIPGLRRIDPTELQHS